MNKNELAYLKKQFKLDGTLVRINQIYSVYINGDNREILGNMSRRFDALEEELGEMLIKNFKKALTGQFDVKLFEQSFNEENKDDKDGSYTILNDIRNTNTKDDFVKESDKLIKKIIKNYPYDKSIVINCIQFTFFRENGSYEMILCTVNKAEKGKSEMIYEHENKGFDIKSQLDPIVNLKSPMDAFMYPVWENESINKDKVFYYSSKSHKVNATFVYNILNCEIKLSAKQEKEYFHNILNLTMGGKIKPNVLLELYEEIAYRFIDEEDDEYRRISKGILNNILTSLGADIQKDIEESFVETLGDPNYEFKIDNILPDTSKKSINIGNSDTEIKITPKSLSNLRQVQNHNGEMFLVVRLNENLQTEGFNFNVDSMDEFNKLIGQE
ncbi:DUF4317 family protein [Alkaliphilus sp. B6464]|uniref:DUF4317 family protein n=1 Tax=Alkaliphilus sp. B6464 TaxID=2731219 RepID=UPI001BADBAE3|nr:DUF4317 family protein [Alkaliphilus sp. B6464]QUH21996.1 DUF4317 family protein [Alkaliphilus sp. B6464]